MGNSDAIWANFDFLGSTACDHSAVISETPQLRRGMDDGAVKGEHAIKGILTFRLRRNGGRRSESRHGLLTCPPARHALGGAVAAAITRGAKVGTALEDLARYPDVAAAGLIAVGLRPAAGVLRYATRFGRVSRVACRPEVVVHSQTLPIMSYSP